MTQDDGWRLMMIGRRLERLQFLADVIARRLAAADTPLRQELEWLLEIGDSAITYRTRYRAPPVWDTTIELLVYDENNPRALAFQWRVRQHPAHRGGGIARHPAAGDAVRTHRGSDRAQVRTRRATIRSWRRPSRRILSQCLKELNAAAAQLSEQLTSQHFSHVDFDLRAVSA